MLLLQHNLFLRASVINPWGLGIFLFVKEEGIGPITQTCIRYIKYQTSQVANKFNFNPRNIQFLLQKLLSYIYLLKLSKQEITPKIKKKKIKYYRRSCKVYNFVVGVIFKAIDKNVKYKV